VLILWGANFEETPELESGRDILLPVELALIRQQQMNKDNIPRHFIPLLNE
jgi:hypothetical protein